MEFTKEIIKNNFMNINSFSKDLGKQWNLSSDSFRDYILATLSMGLVRNNEIIKDINKLYLKDELKYYNAAINSTCIKHIIISQGTLEQEVYGRRILGILLIAEIDTDLRNRVIKLLRKYYPVVYNSVKELDKKALKSRYMQMDENTRILEAKLDAAIYFYFAIYRSWDLVDQGFILSIINEMKNFEFNNPITANIHKELEKHRSQIQEIKSLINREYGKVNSYKDIINSYNKTILQFSVIIENLFLINKIDINYIFQNCEFLNVDKIILAYIKAGIKYSDSKDIVQGIISGIILQSLINEYKKSKILFFENCADSAQVELNHLKAKY